MTRTIANREQWVGDLAVKTCVLCNAGFSFSSRRHHCRQCGMVVCDACSQNKVAMADANNKVVEGQRCCKTCFDHRA
jgi:hypothetical protein